jgi:hypothetical protein
MRRASHVCDRGKAGPTEKRERVPPCAMARWQISAMHSPCKNCLYCGLVNYVSLGDPPPIKSWKRPLLAIAGVALTTCTVLALRFAWERDGATFFAAVSSVVMIIGILGFVISARGCDACVARFLGRTI